MKFASKEEVLPKELFLEIFMFLDEKEFLNTRLLSKQFQNHHQLYWKQICNLKIKENSWLPNVNIDHFRDYYMYYRDSLSTLLKDKKMMYEELVHRGADKDLLKKHEKILYVPGIIIECEFF